MELTPGFESHLAKYRSLQPSLALILHLADVVDGRAEGPVSLQTTKWAAAWCEYLEAHAHKIYASEVNADLHTAHLLMKKIESSEIEDESNARDIYRHHWSGLDQSEDVWAGLQELTRYSIVRIEEKATGGRPTEIVRINPNLRRVA